jgi:polyhydroxyalkanoate synthesis regulator phasin
MNTYERDADKARECVDELIGWARLGRVNDEAITGLDDCRGELFLCIDRLEEEIRRLRREINDLTDSRWEDPHP